MLWVCRLTDTPPNENRLLLHPDQPPPSKQLPTPFLFVGDDACAFSSRILKLHTGTKVQRRQTERSFQLPSFTNSSGSGNCSRRNWPLCIQKASVTRTGYFMARTWPWLVFSYVISVQHVKPRPPDIIPSKVRSALNEGVVIRG